MNKTEARMFLKKQAGNIWTAINELTMDELQETRKVAENYSTTNCWFVEFNMKDSFLKLLDDRIATIKAIENDSRRSKI
jgi:hypothetical protein